ncbi:MAG: phosphopantothenoylcysteine decarboxylase [Candidatus Saccharimonadaceae bacterium]
MIHIVITAGGTEEPIDGIRKVTNMSSGSLGWYCLEAVLIYMHENERTDFCVHYIKAPKAVTNTLDEKDVPFVNYVDVTNTQSVYNSIDKLMNEKDISIFIHAMAISDFAYSYSIAVDDLAEELHQAFAKERSISKERIKGILTNPDFKYSIEDKISSQKEIVIGFKTTPKVISLIKKKNSNTFLVGFKLVKHNENYKESNLINEAEKLRIINHCNAVFANESSQLTDEHHAGILLHDGKIVARPVGKQQIAKEIVKLAMEQTLKDK